MGSVAKKGLQLYLAQLQQHPLRTKMITAGVLSATSDIVAQKLSGIQKLQLKRLLLKVIFGAAYLGPFGHFFHILLDKLFKGKKDTKTVAKKVVVEQLTVSPWNNMMFMLYYGLVIEGRPWIQVKSKIKKEYPTVQYTSWTVSGVKLFTKKVVTLFYVLEKVHSLSVLYAVLACHWMGKSSVCSAAVPCRCPKCCCLFLVQLFSLLVDYVYFHE
ncbi:hypothetical protein ACS0TY_032000 [Phlomoides rotata]